LPEKIGFEIFSVFGVVSKSKVFAGESNMSIVLFYLNYAKRILNLRL